MEDNQDIELLKEIYTAAVQSVSAYNSVKGYTKDIRRLFFKNRFKSLYIFSFGKAGYQMASSLIEELEDLTSYAAVITKYGHALNRNLTLTKPPRVYEAGHPAPDINGVNAAQKIVSAARSIDKTASLAVCLISGGGSALFTSACGGITPDEKQRLVDAMLLCGADISELNTVRKHISSVKGGRFAETLYPARTISLIVSDVIGNKLDVIASGPTCADCSTFADALNILNKYGLTNKIAPSILNVLSLGAKGLIEETPKPGSKIFDNVENIIVSSIETAINTCKTKALRLNLTPALNDRLITGDAKTNGEIIAKTVIDIKRRNAHSPVCYICGGETTVNVKGTGKGGRNMELALAVAINIDGIKGITF
ncbi:hydroxypyruvate reductase, partial [Candidatus Magnetoovum chiemensis]